MPLPLENAAEDYIKYAKALQKEYSDVLEVAPWSPSQGLLSSDIALAIHPCSCGRGPSRGRRGRGYVLEPILEYRCRSR